MNGDALEALAKFNKGFNCAQTVLSVFSEKYGLSKECALKMTCGLGSGVRLGEICGAVTGAVLVIGLKNGNSTLEDAAAKKDCNEKTEEFVDAFRRQNASVICRDILGCDLSTREGRDFATANNLYASVCKEKIKNAIELLEARGY